MASSLVGSVRSLRLRSDEILSSTSNGVYRSAAIKHSTTISPLERAKGIEPTASHSLAWPIIVSLQDGHATSLTSKLGTTSVPAPPSNARMRVT